MSARFRAANISELETDIEEADVCFVPHILHATTSETLRFVALSADVDVLVMLPFFWKTFKNMVFVSSG